MYTQTVRNVRNKKYGRPLWLLNGLLTRSGSSNTSGGVSSIRRGKIELTSLPFRISPGRLCFFANGLAKIDREATYKQAQVISSARGSVVTTWQAIYEGFCSGTISRPPCKTARISPRRYVSRTYTYTHTRSSNSREIT